MRIGCPNCDAQYEVPDEVIPEEGRDVQCSNCNQTWFQKHPDHADPDEDIATETDLAQPEDAPPLEDTPSASPEDVSEAESDWEEDLLAGEEFEDEFEDDLSARDSLDDRDIAKDDTDIPSDDTAGDDLTDDGPALRDDTPEPAGRTRKELDPEVEEILRAEATRETEARAAERESQGLEMQQELGLDDSFSEIDAEERERERAARMARMRGEDGEDGSDDDQSGVDTGAAVSALASRRDMLPDIEEINSTLRSTGDRDIAGDDPDPQAPIRNRKRRGFRRGFLWAVILILIAVLVYVFKAQIAAALPAADPALSAYVIWVDGLRDGLDTQMQSLLKWLDAKAAASEG